MSESQAKRKETRPRWGVIVRAVCGVGVAAVLVITAGVLATAYHLGPPDFSNARLLSKSVVDRNDRLLRAFTASDGRWRLPVAANDVDERYLKLLLDFEDRRFWSHPGVDAMAMSRAAYQVVTNGRIVSGGSTITMQVARLIDRRHDRSLSTKWLQIVRALQLEARLSKRQILNLYLRLAPFGGNLEGIRAASLAYFGKEPRRLSLGQAALLVALPQAPEARRPDRFPAVARRARDRVLTRSVGTGLLSRSEALRAMSEPVPLRRTPFPKLAPHLAERLVAKRPGSRVHKLTLDGQLQGRLEDLASKAAKRHGGRISIAILVADHHNGNILAHVGSADYFSSKRAGAIDMVDAVRSPGSTLKPLIYGLAFERGLAHPETFIEDRPVRFGQYAPTNFDKSYRGTVSIREALGLSLNIPAVKVLDAVGPGRLVGRLRHAGLTPVLPDNARPALPIALGGIGLSLRDLVSLYADIAAGGMQVRLSFDRDSPSPLSENAARHAGSTLSPSAAWYLTNILKDAPPPAHAKAGRIAYKTGTSYGYRDAWAIGYDGRHVAGVWVGRADATPVPGLTGRTAAAPLLFDAFKRLTKDRAAFAPPPPGVIVGSGASLPPPLKRFGRLTQAVQSGPFIDQQIQIAFPPDRSELEIAGRGAPIVLKATGGVLPLTWMVDGAPIQSSRHGRTVTWMAPSRGFVKFAVIDAKGRVDRVVVRLR